MAVALLGDELLSNLSRRVRSYFSFRGKLYGDCRRYCNSSRERLRGSSKSCFWGQGRICQLLAPLPCSLRYIVFRQKLVGFHPCGVTWPSPRFKGCHLLEAQVDQPIGSHLTAQTGCHGWTDAYSIRSVQICIFVLFNSFNILSLRGQAFRFVLTF